MSRSPRVLASLVLGVLLLGACSGGASNAALVGTVTAAASKTTEAGSARVHMITKVTGEQRFTVEADGRMEIGGARGVISVETGALGLPGTAGEVQMRILGQIAYMQVPASLAKEIPAGKKWLKIDYGQIAQEQGLDIGALQRNFQTGDPAAVLGFLRGAGSVEEAGKEKVRGTDTTHYKAKVNFDQVAEKADPKVRDEIRKLVDAIGSKELPVEAWIGADGLLRRLQFTMDLSKLDKADVAGDLTLTMELYDFGVDMSDVVAPPATEVVDLAALLKSRS